ncbi:Lung seven transmembrane receptor family protein [Trifolium repens]|nr:Lung seven transmembrane receptor family protein [Trifolium repens]
MGCNVVRPTLGGLTSKVVMLGGTFFVASEVLELVEHVGAVSDLSRKAKLFLVLPAAVLDVFFILWIFTSLSATLNKLQARRMMIKFDMYRKFTNALAVAVVVSVGWICYEIISSVCYGSTVIWKPKSQGLLVEDTGVKSMLVGNENVGGSGVGVLHAQIRAIFYLKFENENSDQEEQLHQLKLNQTVYCRL